MESKSSREVMSSGAESASEAVPSSSSSSDSYSLWIYDGVSMEVVVLSARTKIYLFELFVNQSQTLVSEHRRATHTVAGSI